MNPVEEVGPRCVPPANLTKRHAYILVGGASGETAIWDITGVLQEWIENHLEQLKTEESSKVKGQLVKYEDKPKISGIESRLIALIHCLIEVLLFVIVPM